MKRNPEGIVRKGKNHVKYSFAKYITREFNSDVAGNTLHTDDKLREHMYSYGAGRERTEHDHTNMLT